MVDKELEFNIKKTKDFIEIWGKFHSIFNNTFRDGSLNNDEEKNFLSTKALVNSRYDDLMDSLGVKPIDRFIKSEVIYSILSITDLSIMSDEKIENINKNWNKSSEFLEVLLERLKRKQKRIEGFNKFFFVMKKGLVKLKH